MNLPEKAFNLTFVGPGPSILTTHNVVEAKLVAAMESVVENTLLAMDSDELILRANLDEGANVVWAKVCHEMTLRYPDVVFFALHRAAPDESKDRDADAVAEYHRIVDLADHVETHGQAYATQSRIRRDQAMLRPSHRLIAIHDGEDEIVQAAVDFAGNIDVPVSVIHPSALS